jgi:hypothetical protein
MCTYLPFLVQSARILSLSVAIAGNRERESVNMKKVDNSMLLLDQIMNIKENQSAP